MRDIPQGEEEEVDGCVRRDLRSTNAVAGRVNAHNRCSGHSNRSRQVQKKKEKKKKEKKRKNIKK